MHSRDLQLLYKYACDFKFIIETGGGGKSTDYLAMAAYEHNAKMITIELREDRCKNKEGVEYGIGWSIKYEDIIKKGDPDFIDVIKFNDRKKNPNYVDGLIAHKKRKFMIGEKDLIRKSLKKYKDKKLDFFFCDSGEYCGLAEWNIVKNEIKVEGYFAIHDIYYPKSIKGFKVVEKIEKSDNWEIIVKTKSKQGLLMAKKIRE